MFHKLLRIPTVPNIIRNSYLLHNNCRHIGPNVAIYGARFPVFKNGSRFYSKDSSDGCPDDSKKCPPEMSKMDLLPKPECPWDELQKERDRKYRRHLLIGMLIAAATLIVLWFNINLTKDHKSKKKVRSFVRPKPTCRDPLKSETLPKHVPYLLIGGGTASFSAFRAIKSSDPTAKVLVISNECYYPYMRPPLSKEMWFNTNAKNQEKLIFKQWNGTERSLFYEPNDFYVDPQVLDKSPNGGVAVAMGYNVSRIDVVEKKAYLDDGTEISYDKCLIATGSSPRNLEVFKTAKKDVQDKVTLYRDIFDYQELFEICKGAESVAIIGGGFLGSEMACALGRFGKESGLKVHQIFREKGNMGKVLPEYLSDWTTDKVRQEMVNIINKTEVEDATVNSKGKLTLHLNNGSKLNVDHVLVSVGAEPNTQLAKTSDLEVDPELGGYLVNAEMEARSHLYVAGDCSCFYDIKLGRRRVEHHDHAVVSGRLAGENMTGAAKPYLHQSMFWSDLGPYIGYEAIGCVDSKLPTVAVFARATDEDNPQAIVTATNNNLRSTTESAADEKTLKPINVQNESEAAAPPKKSAYNNDDFGKGVIFYLRDDIVVGIVLWNVFNRMSIARQVLKDEKKYDDLNEVAKLFNIHED